MELRVLGTAAGGGVPQWNCGCRGCAAARTDPALRRLHASVAVGSDAGWYVVNATPDLPEQMRRCAAFHPAPGSRSVPVAGVILTDAELDHTLGLFQLRQAEEIRVCAPPAVRQALGDGLRLGEVLGGYTRLTFTETEFDDGRLQVGAIPVSAKRPRYAAAVEADGPWSIALSIRAGETRIVYAPAVASWSPQLRAAVEDADIVFFDGTFWDDAEPAEHAMTIRSATAMGHLPIHGPDGSAEQLSRLAARCFYTHLNNTNPLVDPESPHHRLLADLGLRVATDGEVIEL